MNVLNEILEEIKRFLKTNENELTIVQNLWDTVKAILRGKFIAIQAYLKKIEIFQISNLTLHLQELEEQQQNWYHRNTKGWKKLLQTAICQEIWKLEWNGQLSRKDNLSILNEKEAKSLNILITAAEVEAVIKKLLAHKSPGLDGFTGEFHKAFKDELTPILPRLFQKIQEEGRLPNSFYEASIILIPKPDKDKKESKLPANIAVEHRY